MYVRVPAWNVTPSTGPEACLSARALQWVCKPFVTACKTISQVQYTRYFVPPKTQGCSRVTTRPAGRVRSPEVVNNLTGRVGSGLVGSGRVRRCSKSHASGRVGLGDPTRPDPTRSVNSPGKRRVHFLKGSGRARYMVPLCRTR